VTVPSLPSSLPPMRPPSHPDLVAPATLPDGLRPGGRFGVWRPAPPRYVACDVDGTLLSGEALPSTDVLGAIGRLRDVGVRIGVATGRMSASLTPILATGAFTGPHVFHNGALVRSAAGVDVMVAGVTAAQVDGLLAFGRQRDDLSIEVYVGEEYLSDRDDPRAAAHAELLGVRPAGRIRAVADLGGRPVVKCVVVAFDTSAAAAAATAVAALGLAPGLASSPSTPHLTYLNVTRGDVDKGTGIAAAAVHLGVATAEVAVLGDERNDVPAFMTAGTAIAMGDATDEVAAAAHLLAPRYGDAGTVTALDGLLALATQRPPGT
jgi:hydroxymethylpyrimidine pyrophosphatase-like HAD family hydrolase